MSRIRRIAAGEEVFGPSADALVRRIDGRIPADRRLAYVALVESWPVGEGEALHRRLTQMMDGLPTRPPGSARRGLLGALMGGAFGFAVGLLLGLGFPAGLPWWPALAGALAGAAVGGRQGLRPGRMGHVLFRAMLGFLLGGAFCFVAALLIAFAAGQLTGALAHGGDAFLLGVLAGIGPPAGLLGGLVMGIWWGVLGWRRWTRRWN